MTEMPAIDMKFGIIVATEYAEYNAMCLETLEATLLKLGCLPQNIVVREVPTKHDVVITASFFAEYTDVDGVIILAPEGTLADDATYMTAILACQLQWNMVVEVGGIECAYNIVEMILLQNEMEDNAPQEARVRIKTSFS